MKRYVFSPWMRELPVGKRVTDIIEKRTGEWNKERRKKGKEEYSFVYWEPKNNSQVKLEAADQVYIKGHHKAGLDFISDINVEEMEQKLRAGKPKEVVQAKKLKPEDLAGRFSHSFEASDAFTGKIKFFNCSSGVNEGKSFAKIAADRLRAFFPKAQYIGIRTFVMQIYKSATTSGAEYESGIFEFDKNKAGMTRQSI